MAKWERPPELETKHPYTFDKICGYCLTKLEVDFNRNTGGLIMTHGKETKGVFKYESETKKYQKFIFEAEEGVVGYIYFPKDKKIIPSRLILDSDIRGEFERAILNSISKRQEFGIERKSSGH